MEEAAYMPKDMYEEIILPLKSNMYLATLAITTPGNDINWFSYLQDIRDPDGNLLFHTYMCGTACNACIRKGEPERCTHKTPPQWKSQQGIAQIQAVLANDVNKFNREIKGVVTVDQTQLYIQYLKALIALPLFRFLFAVPLVWSFIDPAGGGKGSEYAVVSIAEQDGRIVVRPVV